MTRAGNAAGRWIGDRVEFRWAQLPEACKKFPDSARSGSLMDRGTIGGPVRWCDPHLEPVGDSGQARLRGNLEALK